MKELSIVDDKSPTTLSLLPPDSEWARIKDIAAIAVKSGLLPSAVNTAEKAAIIALKGRELGLPPMVAFAHINVIQGKATMSAEIMLAHIYKAYPNADIEIEQKDDTACIIKAKRPNGKKMVEFKWNAERAKKLGLSGKDNYQKQPGTMYFWRAITEMKRAIFPEVLQGIDYCPEEIQESLSTSARVVEALPDVVAEQPVARSIKAEIINHAPQAKTPAEPVKELATPSAGVIAKTPEVGRARLTQDIIAECKKIKIEGNDAIMGKFHKLVGKDPGSCTNRELEEILTVLKREVVNAKSK